MIKKNIYIAGSIFLSLTILTLLFDIEAPNKAIRISNSGLSIDTKETVIKNQGRAENVNVDFKNHSTNTKNFDLSASNVDFKNSNQDFNVESVEFSNSNTDINHQKTRSYPKITGSYMYDKKFEDAPVNNNNISLNLAPEDLKIVQESGLIEDLNNLKPEDIETVQKIINEAAAKYAYDNLDWGTWKKNLIEKIASDSSKIPELDLYPVNSKIYYRFNVNKEGKVYNVVVLSKDVHKNDTAKLKDLILSYAYTDIVKFPPRTSRTIMNVSSLMVFMNLNDADNLGEINIKDIERIKYRIE